MALFLLIFLTTSTELTKSSSIQRWDDRRQWDKFDEYYTVDSESVNIDDIQKQFTNFPPTEARRVTKPTLTTEQTPGRPSTVPYTTPPVEKEEAGEMVTTTPSLFIKNDITSTPFADEITFEPTSLKPETISSFTELLTTPAKLNNEQNTGITEELTTGIVTTKGLPTTNFVETVVLTTVVPTTNETTSVPTSNRVDGSNSDSAPSRIDGLSTATTTGRAEGSSKIPTTKTGRETPILTTEEMDILDVISEAVGDITTDAPKTNDQNMRTENLIKEEKSSLRLTIIKTNNTTTTTEPISTKRTVTAHMRTRSSDNRSVRSTKMMLNITHPTTQDTLRTTKLKIRSVSNTGTTGSAKVSIRTRSPKTGVLTSDESLRVTYTKSGVYTSLEPSDPLPTTSPLTTVPERETESVTAELESETESGTAELESETQSTYPITTSDHIQNVVTTEDESVLTNNPFTSSKNPFVSTTYLKGTKNTNTDGLTSEQDKATERHDTTPPFIESTTFHSNSAVNDTTEAGDSEGPTVIQNSMDLNDTNKGFDDNNIQHATDFEDTNTVFSISESDTAGVVTNYKNLETEPNVTVPAKETMIVITEAEENENPTTTTNIVASTNARGIVTEVSNKTYTTAEVTYENPVSTGTDQMVLTTITMVTDSEQSEIPTDTKVPETNSTLPPWISHRQNGTDPKKSNETHPVDDKGKVSETKAKPTLITMFDRVNNSNARVVKLTTYASTTEDIVTESKNKKTGTKEVIQVDNSTVKIITVSKQNVTKFSTEPKDSLSTPEPVAMVTERKDNTLSTNISNTTIETISKKIVTKQAASNIVTEPKKDIAYTKVVVNMTLSNATEPKKSVIVVGNFTEPKESNITTDNRDVTTQPKKAVAEQVASGTVTESKKDIASTKVAVNIIVTYPKAKEPSKSVIVVGNFTEPKESNITTDDRDATTQPKKSVNETVASDIVTESTKDIASTKIVVNNNTTYPKAKEPSKSVIVVGNFTEPKESNITTDDRDATTQPKKAVAEPTGSDIVTEPKKPFIDVVNITDPKEYNITTKHSALVVTTKPTDRKHEVTDVNKTIEINPHKLAAPTDSADKITQLKTYVNDTKTKAVDIVTEPQANNLTTKSTEEDNIPKNEYSEPKKDIFVTTTKAVEDLAQTEPRKGLTNPKMIESATNEPTVRSAEDLENITKKLTNKPKNHLGTTDFKMTFNFILTTASPDDDMKTVGHNHDVQGSDSAIIELTEEHMFVDDITKVQNLSGHNKTDEKVDPVVTKPQQATTKHENGLTESKKEVERPEEAIQVTTDAKKEVTEEAIQVTTDEQQTEKETIAKKKEVKETHPVNDVVKNNIDPTILPAVNLEINAVEHVIEMDKSVNTGGSASITIFFKSYRLILTLLSMFWFIL